MQSLILKKIVKKNWINNENEYNQHENNKNGKT